MSTNKVKLLMSRTLTCMLTIILYTQLTQILWEVLLTEYTECTFYFICEENLNDNSNKSQTDLYYNKDSARIVSCIILIAGSISST